MDIVTAAQAELAQTPPLVRHDFQTSLQIQVREIDANNRSLHVQT